MRPLIFTLILAPFLSACQVENTYNTGFMGIRHEPMPGFRWIDGDNLFDTSVIWVPGLYITGNPHVSSSDEVNNWTFDEGYNFSGRYTSKGVPIAKWVPNTIWNTNPGVISGDEEGKWILAAGYVSSGQLPNGTPTAVWRAGLPHPIHPNVISSNATDQWVPAPGFHWLDPSSPADKRVVPDETVYAIPEQTEEDDGRRMIKKGLEDCFFSDHETTLGWWRRAACLAARVKMAADDDEF